jgi:hypothetical protein
LKFQSRIARAPFSRWRRIRSSPTGPREARSRSPTGIGMSGRRTRIRSFSTTCDALWTMVESRPVKWIALGYTPGIPVTTRSRLNVWV